MADKAKAKAKKTSEPEVAEEVKEVEEKPVQLVEIEVKKAEPSEAKTEDKTLAKAGKRSSKAVKEAEEKAAKEERKAHTTDEEPVSKPKTEAPKTRSKLERRGKKYRELAKLIDKSKLYSLPEAIEVAVKTSPVKFDASVEMHINLSVDPRHADQNIRDSLVLPAGTGKTVKVAVFADDANADDIKKAGADISSSDQIVKFLDKGQTPFDVLIATPAQMPKLGKYARVLGPRGLMPNPKSGTVTTDVTKAVAEAKAGKVEYRVDSTGIVHLSIGKVSFGKDKLEQNANAVMASIKNSKPSSVKSAYIKAIHMSTTMGPSINVELSA